RNENFFFFCFCVKAYDLLKKAYNYRLNGIAHEEALFSMHCLAGDVWVECHPVGFFWDTMLQYLHYNQRNKRKLEEKDDDDDYYYHGTNRKQNMVENENQFEKWSENEVEPSIDKYSEWKYQCIFLKHMLRRQIYYKQQIAKQHNVTNIRVIAKSPSMTWCLPVVREYFQDCKIILVVRDPKEMLCRNLSLMHKSWRTLYGNDLMKKLWSAAARNVIWRRYEQSTRILDYLHTLSPQDKHCLVIRYDHLKYNVKECVQNIFEFAQLPWSQEYAEWLQCEHQKNIKKKRLYDVNDLQQYRIPVQPVQELFSSVCQYFQFDKQWCKPT
ncbi:hypothetical protein RFI_21022, partial [Reticulomyxa filosa]